MTRFGALAASRVLHLLTKRHVAILLALAAVGLSAGGALPLSAGAASAQAPAWNSGYNGWWPGGFGFPPVTAQVHGFPCSVTAYGPTFNHTGTRWHQNFGGGTSCAGGIGRATLTTSDQTLGHDGRTWFTISGSRFTTEPITGRTVRMIHNRPAYLGHAYRTVASATLVVPNGHAGCSLSNTCSQTITITVVSRALAP
jgi:hypothetical protein